MANNPTLLSMPLAQNGQKNVIPETQATAGDGLFSQSTGFPAETSMPLGAGGVAPSREDFNGMANLLGGVAFMAQKGFTFNYDASQDYYTGCIVIDPNDGLRYECIADMAAGTVAPSADTAGTYWTIFKSGLDREQIPAFNKRDIITTSGTYTAPVTGWYHFHLIGGGGAGMSSASWSSQNLGYFGGGGGGAGGEKDVFEYLTANQSVTVVVGAGGASGARYYIGENGGSTSITVGVNTYSVGGGKAAGTATGATAGTYTGSNSSYAYISMIGGEGGWDGSDPLTRGQTGGCGSRSGSNTLDAMGGSGGGNGGGLGYSESSGMSPSITIIDATGYGGGGGGNSTNSGANTRAGNGYQGCVEIEYFDESLNP